MKQNEGNYLFYNTLLKEFSRDMRKRQTPAEKRMWSVIRRRAIENCLFLRQKPIHHFIADFYCAKLLLIIEIDGSSHTDKKEMDTDRTMILKEYGITVIRYTNDEILNSLPRVISHLSKTIQYLKTHLASSPP